MVIEYFDPLDCNRISRRVYVYINAFPGFQHFLRHRLIFDLITSFLHLNNTKNPAVNKIIWSCLLVLPKIWSYLVNTRRDQFKCVPWFKKAWGRWTSCMLIKVRKEISSNFMSILNVCLPCLIGILCGHTKKRYKICISF